MPDEVADERLLCAACSQCRSFLPGLNVALVLSSFDLTLPEVLHLWLHANKIIFKIHASVYVCALFFSLAVQIFLFFFV